VVAVDVMVDQGGKMQEKETLDERLPGLFEPDTLLPIQYFEAMRKKHLLEGEKRLILSVLEDAVECFMKCIDSPTSKGQRLFRDADEWIALEDKHWVFSFDNVCDMLDINPNYLRRGLKQWKERKLEAMERAAQARTMAEALPVPPDTSKIVDETPVRAETPVKSAETDKPIAVAKPAADLRLAKVFTPRGVHGKASPVSRGRNSRRSLRNAHA
jgi:hypothetical protein